MKKVLIAGATGMIGKLITEMCLESEEIYHVTTLVRKETASTNTKLKEVVVADMLDLSSVAYEFKNIDIAFFCIGAYTGKVNDDQFAKITVDMPVAFAKALKSNSSQATLCLLSGQGADREEKSKMAFAKYKGMAENQLSNIGLKAFYTFRPAYIYPVTKRKEPNFIYTLSRLLYPIIKLFGKNGSVKSTELASAMFSVGLNSYEKEVIENHEIIDIYQNQKNLSNVS